MSWPIVPVATELDLDPLIFQGWFILLLGECEQPVLIRQ